MGTAPGRPKRSKNAAGEKTPASRQRPRHNAIESAAYFRIDRRSVAQQLRHLWHHISTGAAEIEMVAAEGIFDQMLSHELRRWAQGLHQKANEIRNLHRLIMRANPPAARKKR
jgi:hypothetical protein